MTAQQHRKALNKLKTINKLTLTGKTEKVSKNHYRTDYKHQLIELDDLTLILSGSIENFYSMHHTTESTYLIMSLVDENNQDVPFTKKQHAAFKTTLKEILA